MCGSLRPSLYWTCGYQGFLRSTATLLLVDITKFTQVFRNMAKLLRLPECQPHFSRRVFAFCFPSPNGKNIRCQGRNETYNMSILCIMYQGFMPWLHMKRNLGICSCHGSGGRVQRQRQLLGSKLDQQNRSSKIHVSEAKKGRQRKSFDLKSEK